MEPERNETGPDTRRPKNGFWKKLTRAALFEQFLNKKYVAVTRFFPGGRRRCDPHAGRPLLRRIHHLGGKEVVLGMAHRGRLNVQANILHRPVADILAEFEHCHGQRPTGRRRGTSNIIMAIWVMRFWDAEEKMPAFLVNNPSHLEAVCPVVQGIVPGRASTWTGDRDRRRIVPHPDSRRRGLCRPGHCRRNPEHESA